MAGPMAAKPLGPMAATLGPMAFGTDGGPAAFGTDGGPAAFGRRGALKGASHHSLHEIRNGAWRKRLPIHSIW